MALLLSNSITTGFDQLIPNQPFTLMCAVANEGASNVTVNDLHVLVSPTDGGQVVGQVIDPFQNVIVTPGNTLYFPVKVVFFCPQKWSGQTQLQFTLATTAYGSDGSVATSPTMTVQIQKADHAAVSAAGQFLFNSPRCSGSVLFW